MQVNVQNIQASKVQLDVVVPADVVKGFYDTAYNKIYKNARIDGFRKGHIPKNVFESMYGPRVEEEASHGLFNKGISEALSESKIDVAPNSYPVITKVGKIERNSDFAFSYEMEVYPALEPKDLKSVKTEIYNVQVSDDDINKVVDQLRSQQAKVEVCEGAEIASGTIANIDFLGKKDGVPFEGGEAKGFNLDIDNAHMIPGFTESLMGHKAGEEFTINCTFPESYHVAELAGAQSTFDIKVNSVSKYVLPEVNEDFLKAFGFADKGIEEFKKNLAQNITQQGLSLSVKLNIEGIVEKIAELYGDIELPKCMVDYEVEHLIAANFKGSNIDDKLKQAFYSSFAPVAEDRIRVQVLIHAIVKNNNVDLNISKEELDGIINELSVAYEDPEEYKNEVTKDKESLQTLHAIATERKLVQALSSLTDCSEVSKTFSELKDIATKVEEAKENKYREKMMSSVAQKAEAKESAE